MIRVRSRRRSALDVAESGALSDLAFLLIIFFIVIAVFNVNSGFLLGLPEKGSVTTVHVDDVLRVRVTAENTYRIAERTVTVDEVRQAVVQRRRRQPNMTLMVTLDPAASYQMLVTIVEVARIADVDNFSFRMEERP